MNLFSILDKHNIYIYIYVCPNYESYHPNHAYNNTLYQIQILYLNYQVIKLIKINGCQGFFFRRA